ncbi:MAG: hypothetical protein R3230_01480 [Nitrosopumilaceae archaeon]|nr:hypothetical protein [Nitrosopumilaceae archaeon]
MAQFQFIDPRQPERQGPSPLQQIVGSLTGGLGALYESYEQDQMKKQQEEHFQQKVQGLAQALNVSPEQAMQILMQDPSTQKQLIQQQIQAPMQENYNALLQQMYGGEMPDQQAGFAQMGQLPTGGKLTEGQATNLIKLKQKQQQLQQQADAPQLKEELREISDFKKRRRRASEERQALREVSQLAESGKLRSAGIPRQVMDILGFGDVALNTEEQVVNKLMSKLSVDRLQALGGRPTVALLGEIRKTFPSLLNTPEGIKEISGMIEDTLQMENIIDKELDKLAKKNRGRYPLQAMNKAFENTQEKRDKITQRREKRLQQLMNKSQDSLPDPQKVKRYRDTQTGIIYVSDGQQFIPQGR